MEERIRIPDGYWNKFIESKTGREALDYFEADGYPRDMAAVVAIALEEEARKGTDYQLLPSHLCHLSCVFYFQYT
jgi:hypothetical protein